MPWLGERELDDAGSVRPHRVPRSDDEKLLAASDRRERLCRAGLCINGAKHGPATHGVHCENCWRVHRGMKPLIQTPAACRRGHLRTDANTSTSPTGRKHCRVCRQANDRANRTGETIEQALEIVEKRFQLATPVDNVSL